MGGVALHAGCRGLLLTWMCSLSLPLAVLLTACASSGTLAPDITPPPSETPFTTSTPTRTGTGDVVLSQGTGRLRGTWMFDFELGKEVQAGQGDVWWEQVDSIRRYLVPQNGARLLNLGAAAFDSISATSLRLVQYSGLRIDGSASAANTLLPNAVVAVKTHNGHYAKLIVVMYDYDLTFKWVTYQ